MLTARAGRNLLQSWMADGLDSIRKEQTAPIGRVVLPTRSCRPRPGARIKAGTGRAAPGLPTRVCERGFPYVTP